MSGAVDEVSFECEDQNAARLQFLHPAALAPGAIALLAVGERPAHLALLFTQFEIDALALDLEIDVVAIASLCLEAVSFQRLEQRVEDAMAAMLDIGKIEFGQAPAAPGIGPGILLAAGAFGEPAGNDGVRS